MILAITHQIQDLLTVIAHQVHLHDRSPDENHIGTALQRDSLKQGVHSHCAENRCGGQQAQKQRSSKNLIQIVLHTIGECKEKLQIKN